MKARGITDTFDGAAIVWSSTDRKGVTMIFYLYYDLPTVCVTMIFYLYLSSKPVVVKMLIRKKQRPV
jgi:hypothetical protein